MTRPDIDAVLAVDVGASFIKICAVAPDGTPLEEPRQAPTPYPCAPTRLVATLAADVVGSGLERAGVGFPGDYVDGVVLEPGNLSRASGIASPIDPVVHDAWLGFALEDALRAATYRDVRVVNDATLAALGCVEGAGRELVVTLGTGFGIALVVDGARERIRDVGGELFAGLGTYDEVFGEPARARDEELWRDRLVEAVGAFVTEFDADAVHLGGGNARRVDPARFSQSVTLHDNTAPLRGAARLFYPFATRR